MAARRFVPLVQGRGAHDAHHQLTVHLQGDQRRPDRDAARVVGGRVDRVHDPDPVGGLGRTALFLAQHVIVGERRRDLLAHHGFDRGIGLGHHRSVRLVPHHETVAQEQAHADVGGPVGEAVRERKLVFIHGRRSLPPRPSSGISGSLVGPMQTTIENTDKHTVKLTVEVPADEYEKDMDQTYRSIANSVKIPGFRKGKVPKQIIDAQIGRDVVRDEFLQAAVPDYYRQASVRTRPGSDHRSRHRPRRVHR